MREEHPRKGVWGKFWGNFTLFLANADTEQAPGGARVWLSGE